MLADKACRPSGANATAETEEVWPEKLCILIALQVPQDSRIILASGEDRFPIRRKCYRRNVFCMAREALYPIALQVPQDSHVIPAS